MVSSSFHRALWNEQEEATSDNRRRYRAVRKAVKRLYPTEPRGNLARHLHTTAAIVSGIVGSESTNLPKIARKVPDETENESRVEKYHRWIKNERITVDLYYLPYADASSKGLAADRSLLLAIDGSEVGRGCVASMVSVIYEKRASPIAWIVVEGSKGHFPEETHVQLVESVSEIVPEDADVIFVGDGEFDGITLQATVERYGWEYACRTAKNITVGADGEQFFPYEIDIQPGERKGWHDVTFTQEEYGPVLVIARWEVGHEDPIYLVTNMEVVGEACHWYARRFRIETFFSDQKSRGFNLDESHVSDPERLARLTIAACLAYIWIIYLGVISKRDGWVGIIHRTDRCDSSLFQLGLALLEHFLNIDHSIPVEFQMPQLKSVR